jgi:acyl-CoA hydrolase
MMQWIATCGTIAAARVARGNVVLGAMDDIDFLHPVKVGEVAVLGPGGVLPVYRGGVRVYAESPPRGRA